MPIQDISEVEPSSFWQVLPHEKALLQKKSDTSKLAYLLLLKWFERQANFPSKNDEIILSNLIDHGIALLAKQAGREDVLELLNQERTVNRYKQEIREYFGFVIFDENCQIFQDFITEHIFKEKNDAILQALLCDYLKKSKIEIPRAFKSAY